MNRYEVDVRNPENFKRYIEEAFALDALRIERGGKKGEKPYQEALETQKTRQEREIIVEEEE